MKSFFRVTVAVLLVMSLLFVVLPRTSLATTITDASCDSKNNLIDSSGEIIKNCGPLKCVVIGHMGAYCQGCTPSDPPDCCEQHSDCKLCERCNAKVCVAQVGATCNDGDVCTDNDTCDENGDCVGQPIDPVSPIDPNCP